MRDRYKQVLGETITKYFFLVFIFIVVTIKSQTQTLSLAPDSTKYKNVTAGRQQYQVRVTFTAEGSQNTDSLQDVTPDPNYKGTDEDLARGLRDGTLEKHFVIENGKLQEKITPMTRKEEESFLQNYWGILAGVIIILSIFIYKNYFKTTEDKNNS